MTDHDKLLPKLLEKLFPEEAGRELVMDILAQYGNASWQPEADRVRVAILKLGGKSAEQLRYFALQACRDYRDVLMAAEYPNQAGCCFPREKDPEGYARLEAEDREQYRLWYLGILWEGQAGEQ